MSRIQGTILTILSAIGLLGIATGVAIAIAPDHFVKTDSGVEACQTLADNMAKQKSSDDKPMTEADYKRIRKPFENSKHADIKVAGTNVVDTVYKADTKSKDLGSAMVLLNKLQTQWGQLQVACSKEGVDVPQLPMGS
jgi:hypothetical protein